MHRQTLAVIAAAVSNIALPFAALGDSIETLPSAVSGGTPNIDIRTRYEHVDQQNFDSDANAETIRARLGYTTGKWNDFDAQLELETVSSFGGDQYDSTKNLEDKTLPTVPDPTGAEINQAWLRYTGLPGTSIKAGRQRLIYDNQRFVGNVGWRQNEQTYDGVALTGTWIPRLTFNYAYLTGIDAFRYWTTTGAKCSASAACVNDVPLNRTHLVNINYAAVPWFSVTAYTYLIDFAANPPLPPTTGATVNGQRRDTATYGGRITGTIPVQDVKLSYAVEYASQQDYGDSPSSVGADYYLVEAGAAYKQWLNGKIGYEVLGGNNTYAFQTPLATLHSFQGWADQFLTTPAAGIEDLYISLGGTVEKIALTAVWHDFSPDNGDKAKHYGSEWDLMATRPLGKGFLVGVKYAGYSADNPILPATAAVDVTKSWAWVEYKF
jgi:hypothetical protein